MSITSLLPSPLDTDFLNKMRDAASMGGISGVSAPIWIFAVSGKHRFMLAAVGRARSGSRHSLCPASSEQTLGKTCPSLPMDKEAPPAGTTAGKGSRWPVIQVGLGPQCWREPRLHGRGRALPLSGHGPLTPHLGTFPDFLLFKIKRLDRVLFCFFKIYTLVV